jgi:hypothetical protein
MVLLCKRFKRLTSLIDVAVKLNFSNRTPGEEAKKTSGMRRMQG